MKSLNTQKETYVDKQQLQQQVNDMKAKLAEMEALLNQPAINYWQPSVLSLDKYYYISPLGTIGTDTANDSDISRYRVFKTEAEAQRYADYIKAEEILRKAIAEANKGWIPDWNKDHNNYFIQLTVDNRLFYSSESTYKNNPTFMYIKSAKLAEQLIKNYKNEFITYLSY